MDQEKIRKLNELLSRVEPTLEKQRKIAEIKELINEGDLDLTLKKIDELFFDNNMDESIENEKDEDIIENQEENNYKNSDEIGEKYPKELQNETLEYVYIGLLLNHPKYITKYYFLYDICLF